MARYWSNNNNDNRLHTISSDLNTCAIHLRSVVLAILRFLQESSQIEYRSFFTRAKASNTSFCVGGRRRWFFVMPPLQPLSTASWGSITVPGITKYAVPSNIMRFFNISCTLNGLICIWSHVYALKRQEKERPFSGGPLHFLMSPEAREKL